jgi:hypothetical protein
VHEKETETDQSISEKKVRPNDQNQTTETRQQCQSHDKRAARRKNVGRDNSGHGSQHKSDKRLPRRNQEFHFHLAARFHWIGQDLRLGTCTIRDKD